MTIAEELWNRAEELKDPSLIWVGDSPLNPGEQCAVVTLNHDGSRSLWWMEHGIAWRFLNNFSAKETGYSPVTFNNYHATCVQDVINLFEKAAISAEEQQL
jgi:hypothetical protein